MWAVCKTEGKVFLIANAPKDDFSDDRERDGRRGSDGWPLANRAVEHLNSRAGEKCETAV